MSTEFLLMVALVIVMTNLATVAVGVVYFRGRADSKKKMWSAGIGGMQDRLDDKEAEQ